jgi:transglutaminase-like putative cysteine protease
MLVGGEYVVILPILESQCAEVLAFPHGLKQMDLHAWFEVYVGQRWYAFDATQDQMRGGYVAIGYGRDAADVAVYNQFGPPLYPLSQHISVEQINHPSEI